MLRTSLLLLLALASATVAARDMKHADANGACGGQDGERSAAAEANARNPAAAKPSKPRPSVHGDAPSRLQSPRWHSFLPGMFR
ncbi:hypothetical protein [Aerolutibacter ruishenii]|uniref:Secreted protein n=1 Tax=Aerolutibacter ruishenii TaxID=686800 RepID=A0A562M384_9GAMM|nr:hypothetical protein [Lysobacter ruishenii]TWI14340.1 hypothetical protein IP93_00337 [Lysobacter ruishenii]